MEGTNITEAKHSIERSMDLLVTEMCIRDRLLSALCAAAEKAGYWTLQSTILQDNAASRALHAKCGFRLVEMCIRDSRSSCPQR